jgi:hypothetical protein
MFSEPFSSHLLFSLHPYFLIMTIIKKTLLIDTNKGILFSGSEGVSEAE